MDLGAGRCQIGGDAEIREPQILDARLAEMMGEQGLDLHPADQPDQRQRIIGERARLGEGLADALLRFLEAPAHGEAGGDDGAHAGAAYEVDRDVAFMEGAQHAEMGIGAGAAAGKHHAQSVARQHPCHPPPVGFMIEANVEMAVDRQLLERRHGHGRAFAAGSVQQDEIEQLVRGAVAHPAAQRRGGIDLAGLGDDDDPIGLAGAEIIGLRQLGTAQEHMIVEGFGPGEPAARMAAALGLDGEHAKAEPSRLGGEAGRDRDDVDLARHRQEGHRPGLDMRHPPGIRVAEASGKDAAKLDHQLRRFLDDPQEPVMAELQELAIAQRPDRRRARGARQQRHLADALAGADEGDEARLALAAGDIDAERPREQDIEAVRRIAGLEQRPPGTQRQPLAFAPDGPPASRSDRLENVTEPQRLGRRV